MLAVHADWSIDPRKRWMAIARPEADGWRIAAPEPVGDPASLLPRLRAEAAGGAVALGVDFPLGLPRAFAARHLGAADFPAFLRGLAEHPEFFTVCASLGQVSPAQPFYPARGQAGMTRAAHAKALGLADAAALNRACDLATDERPAGAPLFWTLGANQTGKAAISAWRDMLLPALAGADPPLLWPFAGPLRALLRPGAVAIAETYPAEALRQIGLRLAGSKRRQGDRAACAAGLLAAIAPRHARPTAALAGQIAAGFGTDAAGEDRFDCVLGLLSLLGVLGGLRPDSAPPDPAIQRWEGWVLGQTALPRAARPPGTSPHASAGRHTRS